MTHAHYWDTTAERTQARESEEPGFVTFRAWEVAYDAYRSPQSDADLRRTWRLNPPVIRSAWAAAELAACSTDPLRVLAQTWVDRRAEWIKGDRSVESYNPVDAASLALNDYLNAMPRSPSK